MDVLIQRGGVRLNMHERCKSRLWLFGLSLVAALCLASAASARSNTERRVIHPSFRLVATHIDGVSASGDYAFFSSSASPQTETVIDERTGNAGRFQKAAKRSRTRSSRARCVPRIPVLDLG